MLEKYDLVCGKEDINIDVLLYKFDVDLESLQPYTICTKIIFRCWVEYW